MSSYGNFLERHSFRRVSGELEIVPLPKISTLAEITVFYAVEVLLATLEMTKNEETK